MSVFQAHLALVRFFLRRREDIVERIQTVLSAQRKPLEYLRDDVLLSRHVEDCFFTLPGLEPSQSRLQGQLEDAHWADGFRPRRIPGVPNGLVDPTEMMMRAFHLWRETRWPGRGGRIRYAQTLFNLYVLRRLVMLSLRLWDAGPGRPSERLAELRHVLGALWDGSPSDQPVLLRDARWLIPLAQSPATDDLGAYFQIAQKVAETLPSADRIEIHTAGVCMAGGHLRSQVRYHATKKSTALDVHRLILSTRETNALDFALLIQDLVPLLAEYEQAWHGGDHQRRIGLAGVICQGLSPDPELMLNHTDLLGAYSMLEHLFITTIGEDRVGYATMGARHADLVQDYLARISRVAQPLADDCPRFRPVAGTYSPYGVLYGFSTNLVEHIAFKTLQPDGITHFSLEDVFVEGDADKLAWVNGWRRLPHLPRDVQSQFEYPQQFAEETFERLAQAFRTRMSRNAPHAVGRLFVVSDGHPSTELATASIPELGSAYVRSSDPQLVAAGRAEAYDEAQLLIDRREGKFLVSGRTAGGWMGITKAMLTDVLGDGRDVKIVGWPAPVSGALTLLYPSLVVAAGNGAATSQR